MKFSIKNIKSNLIGTWGLSYVIVIAVMLVATIIVGVLYNSTSQNISNDFNEYVFEMVTKDVNDTLVSMNNVYQNIITNKNITSIDFSKRLNKQSKTYEVIADLRSYVQYTEKIEDAFIYIKDTDTIISGTGISSAEVYYLTYVNSKTISFDDWKALFNTTDELPRYVSVPFLDEKRNDMDAMTLQFPIQKTNFTGVVVSNKQHFLRGLESIKWETLCDIYIYNRSGSLVAYNKTSEKGDIPYNFQNLSYYEENNYKIHTSEIVVNGHAWSLVTVAPQSVAGRNLMLVQMAIICIILLSLIIIFFVVRNILKKNYTPIKTMLSFFNITETTNEYEHLFNSINTALNENRSLLKELDSNSKRLREMTLAKLLRGELAVSSEENHGFDFAGEHFLALAFYLENISELFSDEEDMTDTRKLSYLSFIINNVISELMEEKNIKVYTTEIDEQVVCLLNSEEDVLLEDIKGVISQGLDFINTSFNISLTYALSSVCDGALSISIAYSQAIEVLEHKRLLGIDEPMLYTDASNVKSNYIFDLNKEQFLINAIKTGNSEAALEFLNQIFSELENQNSYPFDFITYAVLDIACMITKTANTILPAGIDFNESLIFYRKIKNGENLSNLYSQMSEYIITLCETIKNDLSDGKNRMAFLISHIIKYVNDNYKDAELNVISLGERFNVNPNYISTNFRKETGETLTNYLNGVRIDKAMKLIKEGKYSKKEIAKIVGFSTERNFYRVLKKYEEGIK